MGLEEKKCKNCKTVYYGSDKEGVDDGHCFMCSVIRKFLKAFDLEDLGINDVDFNRVREPGFEFADRKDPKDWRNYIPEGLKAIWLKLPMESRVLAVVFAEREARAVDIISDVIVEGRK